MSESGSPSNSEGDSGSSSKENGEDSEDFSCPFCSQSFSYQGAHGHLRLGEGVSAERARELIRESKKEGVNQEVEAGGVESDTAGGSVGGKNGGNGPAEAGDRKVGDLGPTVEHVRQRVEDVSDAKAAMKLLEQLEDEGQDRDSAEIAELRGEIRALRSQMSESGGSASGGGEIGQLADLASRGDVDAETVGTLASAMGLGSPEVKRQELQIQKQERRIEHREELIDTVAQKVEEAAASMDGSLFGTLVEGVFSGGGRERRTEARMEPRRDARGDRGERGERPRDGREKSGEAVKTSAQERFEEMAESNGGEEGKVDDEE